MFNLEFVIPAIVLGIIGGFNFNFSEAREENFGKYLGTWAIQSAIFTLITGFWFWLFKPSIVAPYPTIFWFLVVWWLIGLIIAGVRTDEFPSVGAIIYAIFIIIFMIQACGGCAALRHGEYRGLIGGVKEGNWNEDMAPVDEAHVRVVSKEQAQYLADKVLGESMEVLGSRYKVGKVDVCNVNGEIVWAAPLEFRGFRKWTQFKTTPGYVMVSAEDNNRKPVLVDTLKLKYLPSAFWGSNLHRYVYTHGYQGYQLRETSFEVDDNYKPYFTISATKPSISFYGPVTHGVIVVDPQTGNIKWQEPGKADPWIDRIIPEEIAESYINSWGKYVKGWWNSFWGEEGVIKGTPYAYGSDVWFVPDINGNNFWYTGMTSSSSEDQALVGVVLMSTRDNNSTKFYRVSGSNEQAVFDAVTQSLGADAQKWCPTQPIPYNIYGELSFVVPVVGIGKPILQKVAIVRASNLNVALGDDKRSALRQYQRILSSNGNVIAPTHAHELRQVKGLVVRKGWEIQDDIMVFFFLLDSAPDKLFSVTSDNNAEVIIAQTGDRVSMTFLNTDEEIVPASEFDLIGINLKKSEVQTAYEFQVKESEDRTRQIEKIRADEREWENLSQSERRELIKIYREQKK